MSLVSNFLDRIPTWPSTLPSCILQEGFAYGPVDTSLNFKPDAGLGKKRPRYTEAPWELKANILLDQQQRVLFETFLKDRLGNGAMPFVMNDPTDSSIYYSWQFTAPISYQPSTPGVVVAPLNLLRIPGTMHYRSDKVYLVDDIGDQLTGTNDKWLYAETNP